MSRAESRPQLGRPDKPKTIGDVIKRLEEYIPEPLAIFDSLDSQLLYQKIDLLKNAKEKEIEKDKELLLIRMESGHRYPDDQYHLLAHLFLTVRKAIPPDKFDEKREKTNIDGVISLLCGDTKEGKTGKGKSSTVAPIELLFKALWVNNQSPQIFSPPNNNLLNEALGNFSKLRRNFLKGLPNELRSRMEEKTRFIKIKTEKTTQHKSLIEALTAPIEPFIDAYYKGIPIIFASHKTAVFTEALSEMNPENNLFDEIHQLTDEQFISTNDLSKKKVRVSAKKLVGSEIGENIASFVIAKVVAKTIIKGNYFYYQGNELNISEQGYEALGQLNVDSITPDIISDYVLPGLSYNKKQQELIIKTILSETKRVWNELPNQESLKFDNDSNPLLNYLTLLAEKITSTLSGIKPGKNYLTKNDSPLVRESGRGIILPSHQYEDDVDFFIRVADDHLSYRFIPPGKRLSYGSSFATWVEDVAKGKVQGLSANLFRQDLWTGETRKGKLARILETFTSGKVIPAEKEEGNRLPLPDPQLYADSSELLGHFESENVHAPQEQGMIICYNDFLAQDIQKAISDDSIALIISTTPDREVQRLLVDFASGKIKTIITSGRAGYGVDIKKPDGSFPDFHITIINPETQTDISQGFGRLRAEKKKDNFSLILTEDFLDQLSSLFYDKKPLPLPFYHTYKEFQKITEAYKNGEKKEDFNRLFYQLLDLNENRSVDDYLMKTKLELTFKTKIAPVVKGMKEELIRQIAEEAGSPINKMIERILPDDHSREFIRKFVLRDVSALLSSPEEALWLDFFDSASRIRSENPIVSQNESALLDLVVNEFYENQVVQGELQRYYQQIFRDGKYMDRQVSKEVLTNRAKMYQEMATLIEAQLPFEKVDLSKIDDVQITPFMPMKIKKNTEKLRRISDKKKLIKIAEGTYLVSFPDYEKNTQNFIITSDPDSKVFYSVDGEEIYRALKRIDKDHKQNVGDDLTDFVVFPSVGDTDKVATHGILVRYKK